MSRKMSERVQETLLKETQVILPNQGVASLPKHNLGITLELNTVDDHTLIDIHSNNRPIVPLWLVNNNMYSTVTQSVMFQISHTLVLQYYTTLRNFNSVQASTVALS